jgi:hypothetical protein
MSHQQSHHLTGHHQQSQQQQQHYVHPSAYPQSANAYTNLNHYHSPAVSSVVSATNPAGSNTSAYHHGMSHHTMPHQYGSQQYPYTTAPEQVSSGDYWATASTAHSGQTGYYDDQVSILFFFVFCLSRHKTQ